MINKFKKLLNINNLFCFIALLLSVSVFLFTDEINTTVLGINIYCNKIYSTLLILVNLIFFIFCINRNNSKQPIKRTVFLILLLLLSNLFIVNENVLLIPIILLAVFILGDIVNKTIRKLRFDIIVLFFFFTLISVGLLRYFILNDIAFTFSNIAQYQFKISDSGIKYAMFGFLVLIFRLFNFIPFKINYKKSLSYITTMLVYSLMGSALLIKTYTLFDYFFYESQKYIILYLIINALYFSFVQFNSKTIFEFLSLTLRANIAVLLFGLFLYNESGLISFIYGIIILLLSYLAGFILSGIIKEKMGSCEFYSLKKITPDSKLARFFIFFTFLNIAKLPPFACFFGSAYSLINIFLMDTSEIYLVSVPYILFGCTFLLSLNALKILSKIIIEPIDSLKPLTLNSKQKFTLFILCIILLWFGIGIKYIVGGFFNIIDIGNM